MKLECNMFARYKNYCDIDTIAKITKVILSDKYVSENYYQFDTEDGTIESRIIKASHDILDLIELGDYVNGLEVVGKDPDGRLYLNKLVWNTYEKIYQQKMIEGKDIKSVVTKEQLSQMEYKIGE